MRVLVLIIAFAAIAHADVYRFDHGATLTAHPSRCDGGKNISNWATSSTLELDPKSVTLRLDGTAYTADAIDGTWYTFHSSPRYTIVVHVDPFACTDAACVTGMRATFSVIRHPDMPPNTWISADTCYETWNGTVIRTPTVKVRP
jgi:hypothetical protein